MSYNKRLAITQEDYTRLESLFMSFISDDKPEIKNAMNQYLLKAKNESYSQTRIVFDFWHYLMRYTEVLSNMTKDFKDYEFLRSLYSYLNDSTLESALFSILYDEKSPVYIGRK